MNNIQKYADVIDRWESVTQFAGDIGVGPKHAHAMRARDSIPPLYWPRVIEAATKRGKDDITYELLAQLASAPQPAQRLRRPVKQQKRKGRKRRTKR